MTMATSGTRASSSVHEIQLATFYLGDMLFGLNIERVQEINRRLEVTHVPHAPSAVRGVSNLRGEVVTTIDLRAVLGMPPADAGGENRNLVVNCDGELVGLCVDRIADILTVETAAIDPTPPNVSAIDQRYFAGVHALATEIVILLNLEAVLDLD